MHTTIIVEAVHIFGRDENNTTYHETDATVRAVQAADRVCLIIDASLTYAIRLIFTQAQWRQLIRPNRHAAHAAHD